MSDNPFAEPDDNDRTVIRPSPGGKRAAPPPPARDPGTREPVARDIAPPYAPAAPPIMAEGTESIAVGDNALTAAAATLLQLLARLRNTATPPNSGDLRERAVQEVRNFEQRARAAAVPMELLRPAHYALCASIDDVVLNTPWGGSGGWDSRSLISTFHQEVRSGERFFDLLAQMSQKPGAFLPVIELMYLCLSLGFMGRYRLSPRGVGEIDRLREETYAVIARQRATADAGLSPHWEGVAAPYRPSRASVPLWVAAVLGLAIIAGVFAFVMSGLADSSDDLYARMIAAPPASMPTIARVGTVTPPPPPPPSLEPTSVDRLRTFLKPEIDQGLVSVLGTDSTPIVRISNKGMFPSGSGVLQSAYEPILMRIGTALSAEKGNVQVIGYTDNQPIHTVQFPSNFQLSAARAQAARAVVARTVGDPSRLAAEGRADADPIAPNATPEGREQNRRIEIVLHRQDE